MAIDKTDKQQCLIDAQAIIKAYATSANAKSLSVELEEVYKKLKELNEDVEKSD